MSSDQNDETGVPAGWELCVSKKNPSRKYYFNRRTGDSSWCKPQADTVPEETKSKNSKEENHKSKERKSLKRKSDGGVSVSSSSSKKPKEDKPSPEKSSSAKSPVKKQSSTGSIKESPKFAVQRLLTNDGTPSRSPRPSLSPAKRARETPNTNRSSQSPKPTPTKNTASARLSQLRSELSADAKNEEAKDKALAPKSTPEKKQESQTESHSQNNHDQTDSAQAALSPSQFLAANKIIYSMKAQLPDRDAVKPKNAFADIEEGINNQTTEYPFMKHPATPPQFSEASKLMSAINSKLSYRKEPVETQTIYKPVEPIKTVDTPTTVYNVFKSANTLENSYKSETSTAGPNTYKSAKDRMEMFRKRLSSDAMESYADASTEQHSTEAMEVDSREMRLQRTPVPEPKNVPVHKNNASSKENVILVVDTNIFIHELDFIKNIMNSHIEGYTEQPTLLVPWRVVHELDTLKDSNNGNGAICKRARPAMDYLYKSLPEVRIKVQPLRDANSHIYPCESPDDEILNCCLQQAERGKSVILLSNDKNLCTKAVANGVETKQLRALVLRPHTQCVGSPAIAAHLKKHIYTLLSNILENEMRAKYHSLWTRIVFLPPPWTLAGVLDCLLKHWIAVFNEVFPRIEYLIMDLKNSLGVIENKEPNTLTQSEVNNFKELCIEVATRCQIIPEYMQLAKKTVERLCGSESEAGKKSVEREIIREGETPVIEAFEGIWTIFSSYCAKLATNLGIDHRVEDTLPGTDSLDALTSNLSIFGSQISALANAMQGVLAAAVNSPFFNENILKLEQAFKESLTHLGMDTKHVTNANIRIFSSKCRNMLQEAQVKFADLVAQLIHINTSRKRPQDAGCIASLYGNADALCQILASSRVTRRFDQTLRL